MKADPNASAAGEPKSRPSPRPLEGIRIVEAGQLIAGPFAGCMLAYFGAELIKIESTAGDPLRRWRTLDAGTSLWWRSISRNKKCITLNLRSPEGCEIARSLILRSDVLLENFRPGTMEKWGLGPERFEKDHPDLIYARVSGYGQSGPMAHKPGFASVCEGFGGFRHINGFPGQPPVRPNLSLGDTLAGLHAVIGVLLALTNRRRSGESSGSGDAARQAASGQVVDVAIYESIYNVLESMVPEYDAAGIVRGPSGSTLTGIVPTNTYPCSDGKFVIIGGNGDSIYKRLMRAAGRKDLAEDPRLADNAGRVRHQEEVDSAIEEWTRSLGVEEVVEALERAQVPVGPIHSIADLMAEPHCQARGLFERVDIGDRSLQIPAILPKLERSPGATLWPGPEIGSHNREVYLDLLGMDEESLARLQDEGIV
ncbi:MAG: CoA transferase [Ectothiorhodospiraceae bacterium AqS1]|nr:CoA transferase [Ectothiorhodospiraceae bacterium AqS1]